VANQERHEPADVRDNLVDQITKKGIVVYTSEWDSGGLGAGAGEENVYQWNDKFAVTSLDGCEPGPFHFHVRRLSMPMTSSWSTPLR
jgi:hypothetical protein